MFVLKTLTAHDHFSHGLVGPITVVIRLSALKCLYNHVDGGAKFGFPCDVLISLLGGHIGFSMNVQPDFPTWYSQATSRLVAPRCCSVQEWTALQQTARKHFAPQFHAEQPLSISQLADVVGLCCQPPQVVSHAQLGPVEGVGLHSIFFLEGSETPLHSDKYQYCSIYQVHDSEQLKLLQLTCVGQDSRPVDLVPLAGLLVLSAEDFHVQTQNVARFSPNEAHRWDDFGIRGSCFGLRYSESSDIIRHSIFQYLQDADVDGWIGCDQPGNREVVLLLTSDKSSPVKCQLLNDVLLTTPGVPLGN